jgi:predicted DNA-binding protein
MRTELKTTSVRIPEEIRSRLADEVERFSQMLAPRTGVPSSTPNLIRSFLEDFMDAMEAGEYPE